MIKFLIKCVLKFMAFNLKDLLFVSFLLFFSCNKTNEENKYNFKDLDVLSDTNISITKENLQIVNAVAKRLLKDETQIYLKADYINTKQLKQQLALAISKNYDYKKISNKAEALHIENGNIKAEFFNNDNNLSSILYADSAQISSRYNNMIAKGHVVIYSPETNLMLLGEEVVWDNHAKRILSPEEVEVTIIKILNDSQCIQKSNGFESDMNLSNYIFYNIKGKINEECF